MPIERVGRDAASGRNLFVAEAEAPSDLATQIGQVGSEFVCLVAWDSRTAGVTEISELACQLLEAGAVYVCTWGPDCERVHDIVDEERDARNTAETAVVMTTWHSGESLADAIWFALHSAVPDDAYLDSCRATVGISIGAPNWAAEMRSAFADPGRFTAGHPEAE